MITSQLDPHQSRDAVNEDIDNALANLAELPPSRERSLVQTKLDEARMWLDKATLRT